MGTHPENRSQKEIVMKARHIITALFILFSWATGIQAQEVKYSPRYYVNRAEGFISSEAWNSAKREIDAGLEIFPDDPELRYLNGRYYYVIGNLKEARYNLVRSVQENDQLFKAKRILVDIEDQLGHYTSAICYINELLEFQPYDRDLWRRKIAFYRKTGNEVEADAALERLSHIYPNDTLVLDDVRRRNQENWGNVLSKSSLNQAADNLEQWIDTDPKMHDYYMELISVYTRMGEFDKAIGAANRGLVHFPNDEALTNKLAGLMSDLGLYSQAMAVIKNKDFGIPAYNNILYELASHSRMQDPYEANGRLYLTTHDEDALNYLLNTAFTRGYYDDARFYLDESMKVHGRTPSLMMKLYTLEKLTGNEQRSIQILTELYEQNPDDEELAEAYTNIVIRLAERAFADNEWPEAYRLLDRVLDILPPSAEKWPSVVSRQITVLGHLNRLDDALNLYYEASRLSPDNRRRFGSAYEDLSANRLKALMEEERYPEALKEAQALIDVVPDSETALRCLINTSQTMKNDELFHQYAQMGYDAYNNIPYFIVKQAVSLQEQGQEANALELLTPSRFSDEYINPQLTAAYSGISQEWAGKLLKNRMPDIAMQVIDTALVYDPRNRELLYTKGLAYESLKQYDKAFEYQQRYYNPSNAEQEDFIQHMRYLSFRGFRNRLDIEYTHALYDTRYESLTSIGHLYSIASAAYSRLSERNTYTAQVSYKGIDGYNNTDGYEPGGIGMEFMGQWEHVFNDNWSGMANATVSTRYFNRAGCNVSLTYTTPGGWSPSLRLGYRRTPPTYLYLGGDYAGLSTKDEFNIFILSPSVGKAWERTNVSAATNLTLMSGSLYYNVSLKGRFLINNDDISSISLSTGFGSFPELSFFEQTALRNISHTNAMVGLDFQYLLTNQLCLGINGTWNTCYNPYRLNDGSLADSYRNIYSINIQAHIAF